MDPTEELRTGSTGDSICGSDSATLQRMVRRRKDQVLQPFCSRASDQDSARLKFAASDKVAHKKSFLTNQGTGRLALALDIAHAAAAASAHFNLLFIFYSLLPFFFSFSSAG